MTDNLEGEGKEGVTVFQKVGWKDGERERERERGGLGSGEREREQDGQRNG